MSKKAQSVLETVLLISLVTLAWLAMYGYFKSALQGNWKTNIDTFSDEQYDPYATIDYMSIEYISPHIETDINIDSSIEHDFNLTRKGSIATPKILRIKGWGVYD